MNLTLIGHDDRYAVEQLLLSLFPENTPVEATSKLSRGQVYLTVRADITLDGKTASATRRLKASEETVKLRRRALQQSVYLAAIQLLPAAPAWGALAGVRPTKLTTRHLLEGGTFICSGIIKEREEDVQRALAAAGYTVCNRLAKGEWVCLAAKLA